MHNEISLNGYFLRLKAVLSLKFSEKVEWEVEFLQLIKSQLNLKKIVIVPPHFSCDK